MIFLLALFFFIFLPHLLTLFLAHFDETSSRLKMNRLSKLD